MKIRITTYLALSILPLLLHSNASQAELWKCGNGVYTNSPPSSANCVAVEVAVKCGEGQRTIGGRPNVSGAARERCPVAEKPALVRYSPPAVRQPEVYSDNEEQGSISRPAPNKYRRGGLTESQRADWQARIEGYDSGIPSGVFGGMEHIDLESVDPELAAAFPNFGH